MATSRTRHRIARLHRWLAVALAPVLVLIVLSGAVLAFRPILHPDADRPPAGRRVNVAALERLVAQAELSRRIGFVRVAEDGRTAILAGPRGEEARDLATGRRVPPPPDPGPDPFDVALRVHKELWVGLGGLVTLASVGMVFLVLAGPLLARPGRGGGPLGRHIRAGWLLWPLVALLPLSLVMMKLHAPVRSPGAADGGGQARPSLAATLAVAARSADLTRFDGMQQLPSGNAILVLDEESGPVRYVVTQGRVRPLDSRVSRAGRALHAGSWAGRWSGLLNLLAASSVLWVLASGLASFLARRKRERLRRGSPGEMFGDRAA